VLRLFSIKPAARIAGIDCAETAGARAHRAHQHDGRGARVPALTDVRALGFLAHGRQPVFAHRAAHEIVALTRCHLGLQPRRLAGQAVAIGVRARLNAVLDGGKALRRQVLLAAAHTVTCGRRPAGRGFADHRDTFERVYRGCHLPLL
jgi:hypothetical protein